MKCNDAERLLADKALGCLEEDRRPELENHLEVCSRCSREAGLYLEAARALRSSTPEPELSGLAASVAAEAVSGETRWLRLIKPRIPVLAAAAAVVLAIVTTPFFFGNDSETMTRLEVIEAYASDLESVGMGNGSPGYDTGFSYENYGVPENVTSYLIR